MAKQWFSVGVLVLFCAFVSSACQTNAATTPGVLTTTDAQAMEKLQSVLADAMNVARVELGPGDLTSQSTISVLPPRLGPGEDRSVAMPVLFDIVLKGGRCFVVRRETGREYALEGVSCRAINR